MSRSPIVVTTSVPRRTPKVTSCLRCATNHPKEVEIMKQARARQADTGDFQTNTPRSSRGTTVSRLCVGKAFLSSLTHMVGTTLLAVVATPLCANEGGRVNAVSLGDRVLIRATLRTEAFHKDTHVIVDYGAPVGLQVHDKTIRSIAFGDGEQTLAITADGFKVSVARDTIAAETGSMLGEITTRYTKELGNVDASAILGWPVLRRFALGLNLRDGELTLTPAQDAAATEPASPGRVVVAGVRIVGDSVRVPVSRGDTRAWMTFGTAGYHTYLNQSRATDNSVAIWFGDTQLPISDMVALFAQPFDESDEGLLLRSGLGLWSGYALEINPSRGYLALAPAVDSNYSEADAVFYHAAAAEDAEGLRAYAEAWPQDRNIKEAATRLFDIGMRDGFSPAAQLDAVRLGLSVTPAERRMEYVSEFAFRLFRGEDKERHTDLIVALGKEAMRHVDRAENPRARQHLQLMLGDRYLARGDAQEAWKTFLAAGFNGDPRLEGVVRHELGRAYEALGRYRRAYSNYRRVLSDLTTVPPEMRQSAKAALARLRSHLAPDDELLAADQDD